MSKNVAVRALINDLIKSKDDIKIKVKYTDKKRAFGKVISLDNRIVLDEAGEDYILSIADIEFDDTADFAADFAHMLHFILVLNKEQADSIASYDVRNYSDLCDFLHLFSEDLYSKMKELYSNIDYTDDYYEDMDELADSDAVFMCLTKCQ